MNRFAFVLLLLTMTLVGCGYTKPENLEEAADYKGKVTKGGKALSGVAIAFQPLEKGYLMSADLGADGSFEVRLNAGKYAYYFEAAKKGGSEANLKELPAEMLKGDMNRTVTVSGGSPIEIAIP